MTGQCKRTWTGEACHRCVVVVAASADWPPPLELRELMQWEPPVTPQTWQGDYGDQRSALEAISWALLVPGAAPRAR